MTEDQLNILRTHRYLWDQIVKDKYLDMNVSGDAVHELNALRTEAYNVPPLPTCCGNIKVLFEELYLPNMNLL